MQNYLPAAWWGREHAWSLAIEEHFYFLLPPVLMLLLRWGPFRRAPVRWAAGIAAALGGGPPGRAVGDGPLGRRSGRRAVPHPHPAGLRSPSAWRSSVLWHFAPARVAAVRRFRWLLLAAGLLLTVPCYLLSNEHPFVLTFGLTLNYLGYGMLLAAVLTLPRLLPKPLGPALAYVGFYSYSIYLWHLPFLAVVRNAFGDRAPGVALFYAGSIVLGVLVAKLVELPALRLRERWVPGQPAR